MKQVKIKLLSLTVMAMLVTAAAAGQTSANKSRTVPAGASSNGESTVNGSISIGKNATISGAVETVNGTLRIDENARVEDAGTVNGSIQIRSGVATANITSVNGSIRLDENVTVDGEVSVVNGKISLGSGTTVADSVNNINGTITVEGSEIGGDLSTVNGDVTLSAGSTLHGNLIVEKPGGWGWKNNNRKPKIVIGPETKVLGDINLEREVELYISTSASVGEVRGTMTLAEATRFSGARP